VSENSGQNCETVEYCVFLVFTYVIRITLADASKYAVVISVFLPLSRDRSIREIINALNIITPESGIVISVFSWRNTGCEASEALVLLCARRSVKAWFVTS
jgi:hypothetical protein